MTLNYEAGKQYAISEAIKIINRRIWPIGALDVSHDICINIRLLLDFDFFWR